MSRTLIAAALGAVVAAWCVTRPPEVPFIKHAIDLGASETCAVADINGDGKPDIVSGENWYEGPKWVKHRFRDLPYTNYYIDDFSDLPVDVNGDGKVDLVSCSWFAHRLLWFENPGRDGAAWREHPIEMRYPVEFAFLVDLNNDGRKREVLPEYGSKEAPLAWYEISNGQYVAHVVSDHSYGHGIGAGDVNGDGRNDILTPEGWFEAPADVRKGEWKWHPDWNLGATGFLYVLDVNGDGRNDVVSSMAHDYGVFWLEHGADGKWTKHVIDDSWSQAHAVTMADMNGDGQMDFVTGKRFWAHNGRDPGGREPLGVYWYEFIRPKTAGGKVEWVRHVVDYGSRTGGGMQIPVADLDGDGDVDFAVAGKGGLFWFENRTR